MPLSSFGVAVPEAPIGEFGTINLRIDDVPIAVAREFTFSGHFLTPTDPFHMVVSQDQFSGEFFELFKPGSRVQFSIDESPQFDGYLDKFGFHVDRSSGSVIQIQGRDKMSAVVDSQIDPEKHYPDKMPLQDLLEEILLPFGFEEVVFSNADNVEVSANLALKHKRGGSKHHRSRRRSATTTGPGRLPLPKSKPEHNDTYYQFLSRILNRAGVWMWPSVDGRQVIVGAPTYDQEPVGQLRRVVGGLNNNIISGGINIDAEGVPNMLICRGAIPPRAVEHTRTRVAHANPLMGDFPEAQTVLENAARLLNVPETDIERIVGGAPARLGNSANATITQQLATANEAGTFNSLLERYASITENWTTYIPAKSLQLPIPFASKQARPIFIKDRHSRTPKELEHFARKQMSLYIRKAFTATYTFEGFYLDGAIPVPDTIVNVIDEPARFEGNLWVLSRTMRQSRQGGTTTELELLLPNALVF